jgi:phosphate transport system substrate-binding protein
MAEDLDYVPLPAAVVDQIKATWAAQIKSPDGKPVYAAAK